MSAHAHRDGRPAEPRRGEVLDALATLPLVLVAVFARAGVHVPVCPHNHERGVWCFRLGRAQFLEIGEDGSERWIRTPDSVRARLAPLIVSAREIIAAAPPHPD